MMSLGQRPNINTRSERKYSGLESMFRPRTVSKLDVVDKPNEALQYLRGDIPPSSSGTKTPPALQNDSRSSSMTDRNDQNPSPKMRHAFTRNPSMPRSKKFNRRSMPIFKLNINGISDDIGFEEAQNLGGFVSYVEPSKLFGETICVSTSNSTANGSKISSSTVPHQIPLTKSIPSSNVSSEDNINVSHTIDLKETNSELEGQSSTRVSSNSVRRVASFPASASTVHRTSRPVTPSSPITSSPLLSLSPSLVNKKSDILQGNISDSLSPPSVPSSPSETFQYPTSISPPSVVTANKPRARISRNRSAVVRRKRGSQISGPRVRRVAPKVPGTDLDQVSTMVLSKGDNTTFTEMTEHFNVGQTYSGGSPMFNKKSQQNKTSFKNNSHNIMSFEDDELETQESEAIYHDHGPFSDFEELRHRPAHLAVFFNFVLESKDPANFLLTLAVDSYKLLTSAKDMLKSGDVLYRTYLASNAIYKVKIDSGITASIQSVLQAKNQVEDALRVVFDPAVQIALKEVRNQLETYCKTRERGIGNLYGDEKIQTAISMEQQTDSKIVDDILTPTITKLQQISFCDDIEQARVNIKLEALQSFLNQYGLKKGKKSSKIYSKFRSKPPPPVIRTNRISGSMDSIIDDTKDKRLSTSLGGIFVKKLEKTKSKSPTHLSYTNDVVHSFPQQQHNLFPATRQQDVQDALSIDRLSSDSSSFTRSESFGDSQNQSKRGTKGNIVPQKSHSDPDTNKVEQAVYQHNKSSEQSDASSSHHTIQNNDIHQSVSTDDRKLSNHLPSFHHDEEISIDGSEKSWVDEIPKNKLRNLDRREVKRQQVINELISTEQHHVRDLKILEKLFYEPLFTILKPEELHEAFPNLRDLLQLHRDFNRMLQEKREADELIVTNIGDILLKMFDGDEGNIFKNECATYCGNQSSVLSMIKEKTKNNHRFSQFLEEAYKHPVCRRLTLKDFIPMEFQRLTKYPLLLENIIKHTKKKHEEEINKVKTACTRCREILSFVNQTVKEAEDKQKIIEIEKRLDKDPLMKTKNPSDTVLLYKNRTLSQRLSIHQGALMWRLGQGEKRKMIPIHCILYDDVMVLLQKQDERYVLRCHEAQMEKVSPTYDPFITMSQIHVRNVATDKRAFFVVCYQTAQMYEFVCNSSSTMKTWVNIINKTAKTEAPTPALDKRRKGVSISVSSRVSDEDGLETKSEKTPQAGDLLSIVDESEPIESQVQYGGHVFPSTSSYVDPPVNIHSKIITKNQEIINALTVKYQLFADMSELPVNELESMLDMCVEDPDPDPSTLIRHAVVCADKLTKLINDSIITENVFIKPRRDSSSNSKRLSTGPSDIVGSENIERWSTRLSSAPYSAGPEKSLSPHGASSNTLNSISDLPYSESEMLTSPNLDLGGMKYSFSNEFEKPCSSAASDSGHSPSHGVRLIVESPTGPVELRQNRSLSVPTSGERSTSRPSSEVDLCVSAEEVAVDKMLQIALLLQKQLTRLTRVNDESEKKRILLKNENARLKEEIRELERVAIEDGSPPYCE